MTTPQSSQSPGGLGDRALLEAAAKAAGMTVPAESAWGGIDERGIWMDVSGGGDGTRIDCWNPLTDDGDALRLAAHLRLKVLPGKHKGDGCTVESQRPGIAGCTAFRDDPAEQMRFAIVFVAAEIGAAMASERGRG